MRELATLPLWGASYPFPVHFIDGFRLVLHVEFLVDLADMLADGMETDAQLFRDLLI